MYEQKTKKILKRAGFPDWVVGFDDLVTVVEIAAGCDMPHGLYSKYIIPRAAKQRNRKPQAVEKSMRTACEWAYSNNKDRVEREIGEIPVKPGRSKSAPMLTSIIHRLREKVLEESEVEENG